MPLFISIDVLKVLPYLLMILLHTNHFLPLSLSHVPYLFYCHYSHFLNFMIDLLKIERLSFYRYFTRR